MYQGHQSWREPREEPGPSHQATPCTSGSRLEFLRHFRWSKGVSLPNVDPTLAGTQYLRIPHCSEWQNPGVWVWLLPQPVPSPRNSAGAYPLPTLPANRLMLVASHCSRPGAGLGFRHFYLIHRLELSSFVFVYLFETGFLSVALLMWELASTHRDPTFSASQVLGLKAYTRWNTWFLNFLFFPLLSGFSTFPVSLCLIIHYVFVVICAGRITCVYATKALRMNTLLALNNKEESRLLPVPGCQAQCPCLGWVTQERFEVELLLRQQNYTSISSVRPLFFIHSHQVRKGGLWDKNTSSKQRNKVKMLSDISVMAGLF